MASKPIVNKIDNRKGAIAALIAMVLFAVYFALISFQIADPAPEPLVVNVTTEIPELELQNLVVEGPTRSGSPSDAPLDKPKPQTEQIITSEESDVEVNTGQSNTTNAPNSTNTSSTTQQSNDPFASGGDGNGDSGGSGDTFGGDSGTGTEGNGGGGSGKGRIRLNDPIMTDLQSNIDATIQLKLTIDAQGNVIAADNIKAQTTTTNQILINRVIYEVKKQVKYNIDPGSSLAKVFMAVHVNAQ